MSGCDIVEEPNACVGCGTGLKENEKTEGICMPCRESMDDSWEIGPDNEPIHGFAGDDFDGDGEQLTYCGKETSDRICAVYDDEVTCMECKKIVDAKNVKMGYCPVCKKEYPLAIQEARDGRAIQDQFPNAKPHEREQLMTGICSDACWESLSSEPGEEEEKVLAVCGDCGTEEFVIKKNHNYISEDEPYICKSCGAGYIDEMKQIAHDDLEGY